MNETLSRQIEEYIGSIDEVPAAMQQLLAAVSDTYNRLEGETGNAAGSAQQAYSELRRLVANINEACFSVDMREEYNCTLMTEAAERIYGRKAEDFLHQANLWYDLIIDEDKEIIHKNYPLLHGGNPVEQEYRIRHSDGGIRWLESKLVPTLDDSGKLIRIDGLTSDITARKEAEAALKQSEDKFRSMIEYNADAIMILNEQLEVVFASDSLYRIMGYTKAEVIGMRSFGHVYPADLPHLMEHGKDVMGNPGKPYELRYRRIKKDGTVIWCEGTAVNLLDKPGIKGIVVNFRDVTERVEVELALQKSENKLRSLLKNSSDVITVVNEHFEVTFASESVLTVTGFSPEDVKNTTFQDYVHPEDREIIEDFFRDIIDHPGEPKRKIYRSKKKDGSYYWCERISVNLLNDPDIQGIVSNYRDITERRKHLEAVQAANEELKKSNMELDRFVYSVSHDLRAPLSSMLGVIGMMETEHLHPETAEDIELLKGSIRKLDGFILDILDYSKNARLGLKLEPVDFKEKIGTVIDNLRFMSGGDIPIDIVTEIEEGATFYSDRSRLNIIFNNLISNAIRYYDAEQPAPFIKVSVHTDAEYASIVIADNGIGIPAEKHEQVFEMFYRLSSKSVGSGLGLYIVKETVEKLDGTMTLRSEPGKGTEFAIVLPNKTPRDNG